MDKRTVWVLDPDPIFHRKVRRSLEQAGHRVAGLDDPGPDPPWDAQDALVVAADLLPVPSPPATVIALIPRADQTAAATALAAGAGQWLPREPSWLPHLPALLETAGPPITPSPGATPPKPNEDSSGVGLRERIRALQELTAVIGSEQPLPEVFEHTREALQTLIEGARVVFFTIADEEGESLRPLVLASQAPLEDLLRQVLGRSPPEVSFPLTIFPVAWRDRIPKGEPCTNSDIVGLVRQTIGPQAAQALEQIAPFRGLVGLPLRSGGMLRGMIFVVLAQEHIQPEDLELAMSVANLVSRALESTSLLEHARRRVYSLECLFELSKAIAASLEPLELSTIATRQFLQALHAEEASISLWDREEDVLRTVIDLHYDQRDDVVSQERGQDVYALKDFPATREVLETRQPLQMLASDATADAGELAYMREAGVKTLLIVPLVYKGRAIGVVELEDTHRERRFAPDEVHLAMTLAGQVAAALENARLFTETQQQAVQLRTAAEVAQHATAILDVEELLAQTAELIRDRFGLYYVGIYLVDQSDQMVYLRAGTGEAGRKLLETGHKLEASGPSLVGRCVSGAEAVIAVDVGSDAAGLDDHLLPNTRSRVALPLTSRGQVIGAMAIHSTQPAAFTQDNVSVFQTMAGQLANAIENASLHEEHRRRLTELAALYEIGRAITVALDPHELIELVHHQVGRFTEATHFYIALWEPETNTIRIPLVIEGDHQLHNQEVDWTGLVGWVLRNNESLLIHDMDSSEPQIPSTVTPQTVGEAHARSVLIVPLAIGDRTIGALSVQSMQPGVYSQRDADFVSAVASQVAIAAENARLYEQERRRARQASLLNVVAQQTNAILSPERLLPAVAQAIHQHFDYDTVSVLLADPTDRSLYVAAKAGVGAETIPDGYRQSLEMGILGWVARTGEPLLTNDTSQEELYFSYDPERHQAGSELAVPLVYGGETRGVLDLQCRETGGFDPLDLATAQTMAVQIAVALQNAHLYADARRHAEEMAALNTVAGRLGQSLELQEVLETAMEEVIRVLGVNASAISLVDQGEEELLLCAQRGLHFPHVGTRVRIGEGLSGHVALTGEVLITGDISEDPRMMSPGFVREQVQAMILVPMHSSGQVVGVLSAMNHTPLRFTEREVSLLRAIANQVGAAAEQARLYQEVREHVASLEEAYARLKEIDQLKDELIQNVSHELRTPLTFLKGYVQLLMDEELGPLTEKQRGSLDVVARKTDQLNRLITDIVTLQMVTRETLDILPVDVGRLARMALEDCRPAAAAGGIELRAEIGEEAQLAMGDPARIHEVFDNLLSNAIKFSPNGGTITVRVEEDGPQLRVEVRDTGIGIPEEKLPRVFERFYQVDGSSRRRFGGAGLGLAIVKRIIEAHGGQVGVSSRAGEGSTFHFTLPKSRSERRWPHP